jgi:DNA polymerase (family 10)
MGTVSLISPSNPVTNHRIANVLFNIATLLDMAEDNIYRVRAYRRAARRILALREEATAIVARGEELPLPGVGKRIRRKLAELIATGALSFYTDLLEDQPEYLRLLLALESLGPVLAKRLHEGLGVSTPEELLTAAQHGRVRTLYGFGPRREALLAGEAARALDRPSRPVFGAA